MENEYKKINESEFITLSLFLLSIDAGAALVDTTFVGMLIVPFGQAAIVFFLDQFFFKPKGGQTSGKLGKQIAKYAAGLLPWVPTTLIIFYIEVFLHNHPKIGKIVKKGAAVASGLKAAKAAEGGLGKKIAAGREAYRESRKQFEGVTREEYEATSARLQKTAASLERVAKLRTAET